MNSTPRPDTTRRNFLTGLLAAPFILRTGLAMPVRPNVFTTPPFLLGDLVDCRRPHVTKPGTFIGARIFHSIDGDHALCWNNSYGPARALEAVQLRELVLFEGLPGNRVGNPSMRHRLYRPSGSIGLSYPGDDALRMMRIT